MYQYFITSIKLHTSQFLDFDIILLILLFMNTVQIIINLKKKQILEIKIT